MCKGEMTRRWVKNHEWKIHACGGRWVDHLFENKWKVMDEQNLGGKYWRVKDGWKSKYGWNMIGGSLQMGGE